MIVEMAGETLREPSGMVAVRVQEKATLVTVVLSAATIGFTCCTLKSGPIYDGHGPT